MIHGAPTRVVHIHPEKWETLHNGRWQSINWVAAPAPSNLIYQSWQS